MRGYLMSANAVGIGILGFGGFAMFAAHQFAQVPGAALRDIAGTDREASLVCAERFGLADVQRADELFAMPDVHLVYIATPPFLHYEQARAALRGGKHVIVEKPLAVTMEQADEIVSLARETRRTTRAAARLLLELLSGRTTGASVRANPTGRQADLLSGASLKAPSSLQFEPRGKYATGHRHSQRGRD
jgi:hypothetical protein